jgi:hypothetical protein
MDNSEPIEPVTLLPCPTPWCESSPTDPIWSATLRSYYVKCEHCHVQGPLKATAEQAIVKWNEWHRTTPAPITTEQSSEIADRLVEHFPTGLRSRRMQIASTDEVFESPIVCDCHCGESFSGSDKHEVRELWAAHAALRQTPSDEIRDALAMAVAEMSRARGRLETIAACNEDRRIANALGATCDHIRRKFFSAALTQEKPGVLEEAAQMARERKAKREKPDA